MKLYVAICTDSDEGVSISSLHSTPESLMGYYATYPNEYNNDPTWIKPEHTPEDWKAQHPTPPTSCKDYLCMQDCLPRMRIAGIQPMDRLTSDRHYPEKYYWYIDVYHATPKQVNTIMEENMP